MQGEAHEGDEKPVEDGGTRQAIGELLTCSRCIGMWAAAGVVGLHTVAPRSGRLLTWSLAAAAANDFLQAGFSALTAKANELEQRAAASARRGSVSRSRCVNLRPVSPKPPLRAARPASSRPPQMSQT